MNAVKQVNDQSKNSQIEIYQDDNGNIQLDVRFDGDTAWLTQKMIAQLFDVDRTVITKHLQNIFKDGELDQSSTSAKFALVQKDGTREVLRLFCFLSG